MRKVAGRWGSLVAALAVAALVLPSSGPAQGTGPSADLTLTNADSPDPVQSGATLTYTVTVRNQGPTRPPTSR
jgi:acyl dehydratase